MWTIKQFRTFLGQSEGSEGSWANQPVPTHIMQNSIPKKTIKFAKHCYRKMILPFLVLVIHQNLRILSQ